MPKIKNDAAVPKPKKAVYTDTYFSLPLEFNLSFNILILFPDFCPDYQARVGGNL